MKRFSLIIALLAAVLFSGCNKLPKPEPTPDPDPDTPSGEVAEASGITYQLLVYSFCDSNSDGIGDFKGIQSKLDYFTEMGVQALWLSPIHPASSYHGYDVLDYSAINPEYGTEADFKALVDAAHAKGIKIYLDYVLNHTSKDHPWFLEAKADAGSKYRDYFIFSADPAADIKAGKIAMISSEGSGGYDSGQWFSTVSSSAGAQKIKFTVTLNSSKKPATIKAEQVSTISNVGSQNSGVYLYYGDGNMAQFYTTGGTTLTLSLEISSSWGVLVRTSTTQWDSYKYGAPSGANKLSWDTPINLSNTDAQDILLPGMTSLMYHSHFWTSYFADLNYGSAATCENSAAFKDVCTSADKWIGMGIDGFRLDAIKHIYHNAASDENPTFLGKFYNRCNTTYKAAGHTDDIYMIGEHYSAADQVAPYYSKFPGFFDFSFWWTLKDAINNGTGKDFVGTIQNYQKMYAKYNANYVEGTKLSNHDEDRTGSDLGKSTLKMKLAGAVLLTCGGEPYIYQGEELGYWGTKTGGDEYVRTPIMWKADGSSLASKKLSGKIDNSMLTAAISVEKQAADASSVLGVYRTFGALRAKYKALAKGTLDYCPAASGVASVSAWYRTYDGQKVLVVHNFGAGSASISFTTDKLTNKIGSNGTVTVSGSKLTLGGYSSAVFLQ